MTTTATIARTTIAPISQRALIVDMYIAYPEFVECMPRHAQRSLFGAEAVTI
jgi:hypothetical protein